MQNGHHTPLYAEWTLDRVVTRHKPQLVALLEDFVKAQKGQSAFCGFGTYNLGIMLHGPPGTGKTSLIRGICNYLQRNAVLLNLREVKTIQRLRDYFLAHGQSTVMVWEEFDYVQGIFSTEACKSDKTRLMQLFSVMHKDLDAESRKTIQKQIEEEETRLKDEQSAITLDNLLLLMDGLQEMRGRVIITTTNHIDKINEALLRPGRFDLTFHMDKFTDAETKELLCKMFPDKTNMIMDVTFPDKKWSSVQIINMAHQFQKLEVIIPKLQ